MPTIELTNNEAKILWDVANYYQSLALHRHADLLAKIGNNEEFTKTLEKWNQETIDECELLFSIKRKLNKFANKNE